MEKNLNSRVQSLWIGGQLSNVEKLCIQSFIDHGHEFHLYTYEEMKDLPVGTKLCDANEIMPEQEIFRYKHGWAKGSVSGFADVFRLKLIQKKGGWWVDMDIICLKKLDQADDDLFCSSYEGEYGSLVNNCIFKLHSNSPFIKTCLDYIQKIDLENMDFGLAGPFLFQKVVRELELSDQVKPFQAFNPISWKNIGELVLDRRSSSARLKEHLRPFMKASTMPGRRITEQSYTLHLWNEVWKNSSFDKNGVYSKNSLFEKLKKKHQIS
ncbi:capsular polysaccharide synthesis protein [Pedobacter sandarakinus]|uniref:capsular polysaccharide synthesis protein n=1 Tax=Pedobacter sandarakinus TaxID=353156 RepID=UPI0022460E79|nr:capsular polysaccharide synthesis protein [Pedobacter sandarakinus]MCX2575916.1 glycosyltransferase [Pedobacter sandarakinus]